MDFKKIDRALADTKTLLAALKAEVASLQSSGASAAQITLYQNATADATSALALLQKISTDLTK